MLSSPVASTALELNAERVAREVGIPPCPAILTGMLREARKDDPDLRKLASLVGSDVGLSATLLKTVNSPFYGLASKAATVQQALSILGLRAGINLITGLLLRQAFPVASSGMMEEFWERSMRLAAAAAALAPRLGYGNRDEAHTYALFRDCGLAVMIRKFPLYADIVDYSAANPGQAITEVENIRYEVNHARVGYALARSWHLPETLGRAIFHHHDAALVASGTTLVSADSARLIALGLLAEQLCAIKARIAPCADWPQGAQLVSDAFDLGEDEIETLAAELDEALA